MKAVTQIADEIPPPACIRSPASSMLHSDFGPPTELPEDYLCFLRTFGPGYFANERYKLSVLDVTTSPDLLAETIFSAANDCSHRINGCDHYAYPRLPSILPWGCDDQGLSFNWIVDGPPSTWKTVVGRIDYWVYNSGMVTLMHDCIFNSIPFYSDDTFGPGIAFYSAGVHHRNP